MKDKLEFHAHRVSNLKRIMSGVKSLYIYKLFQTFYVSASVLVQ